MNGFSLFDRLVTQVFLKYFYLQMGLQFHRTGNIFSIELVLDNERLPALNLNIVLYGLILSWWRLMLSEARG
jgi:hypothetical protein